MMVADFLNHLRSLEISLAVEGDRLRLSAPKGVLTPALQSEISTHKAEILAFYQQARGSASDLPAIQPLSQAGPSPLSVSQERIWTLAHLFPDNPLYHMYLAFQLHGPLDPAALEMSLARIVERHAVLRARFQEVEGNPRQVFQPYTGWALSIEKTSGEPFTPSQIQTWAESAIYAPFDIEKDNLLRVRLLALDPRRHVLVLVMHHLVSDGWSWQVFLSELADGYQAYCSGQLPSSPDLPVQYSDFAVWQQQLMSHPRLARQEQYWSTHLENLSPDAGLPVDFPPSSGLTYHGKRCSLDLPPNLTGQIKRLSQQAHITLFQTLLAAFNVLLFQSSGQEDILVWLPVACRNRAEIQPLVGYFNNLVAMRSDLSGSPTFLELTNQVHQVTLEAYENQDLPFHKLFELPGLTQAMLSRPVFTVQDGMGHSLSLPSMQVIPLEIYAGTANFPLFLSIEDRGETLRCVAEYQTNLYASSTIESLLADFADLLEQITTYPDRRLAEIISPSRSKASSHHSPPKEEQLPHNVTPPRSQLEAQLVRIWEETLQIKPIGVQNSFFELGGHSLLALQLFGRIEHELGSNLPLASLLANPTIEHLARLINDRQSAISWDSLVPIQLLGSMPPFFGVHGMDGNVLYWRSIVEHLGTSQPFYGLQAQGVDGLHPALTRIEDMAWLYLREIRRLQPEGPYYLGGFSMGGEIAFEMARQLAAAGQKVGLLVMFDTANPSRPVREMAHPSEKRGDKNDQSEQNQENQGHQEQIESRPVGKLERYQRKLRSHANHLSGLTAAERAGYLSNYVRMHLGRAALRLRLVYYRVRKKRLPNALLLAYLQQCHLKAVMEYIPQVYPGRITLFRASQSLERNPLDDPLGWGPLADGGIELHLFDSTHRIVDPEFAQEVGSKLQECLARARNAEEAR